jgi:hypothetical protein
VRHLAGEGPLEETRRAGEDQPGDPAGLRQRELERDMTTERIADDDGRRQLERLHETPHVIGQARNRDVRQAGIEDRQRQGDRAAEFAQGLEHGLPVVHLAHEPMQQHHGLAVAALEPSKSSRRRLNHVGLLVHGLTAEFPR